MQTADVNCTFTIQPWLLLAPQQSLPRKQMKTELMLCKPLFVTVLAKTCHVRTKTEFNFIAAVYRHTQYLYPSPLYQVSNANWSAFLKGILPTLQSHGWNNGTHGECQLDSGDLYLLPLAVWPTGVLLATVWASWLLMECP